MVTGFKDTCRAGGSIGPNASQLPEESSCLRVSGHTRCSWLSLLPGATAGQGLPIRFTGLCLWISLWQQRNGITQHAGSTCGRPALLQGSGKGEWVLDPPFHRQGLHRGGLISVQWPRASPRDPLSLQELNVAPIPLHPGELQSRRSPWL